MSTTARASKLTAVCKLRPIIGRPMTEQMSIKNITALMMMTDALMTNDLQKQMAAEKILDDELDQYLAGIKHTVPFLEMGFGMGDIGETQW